MYRSRLFTGITIWIIALSIAGYFLWQAKDRNRKAATMLLDYSAGPGQFIDLHCREENWIGIGDPIFLVRADGSYQRVGEITKIKHNYEPIIPRLGWTNDCQAMFYRESPLIGADCTITMHETPASLEWVINEMTKDGAWEEYKADLIAAFEAHNREILNELRPVMESGLREAAIVVAEDLRTAFEKRQDRISEIAARYENDLVKQKIMPLIQEEIWPIIRARAEPTMNEVGNEIWQRTSVWRFGWRMAYDKMPLPRKELTRREWERFVDEEIVPVLEAHFDEFVQIQKEILADVAQNDEVRRVFRESVNEIVNDSEIRQIVEEIVVEVFVNNPRLNQVITDHWNSPQAKRALSLASERFQATIVTITEKMFGTPETQITPSFARVLRNQVLRKDNRWFVVDIPAERAANVRPVSNLDFELGITGNENPFVQQKDIPHARDK